MFYNQQCWFMFIYIYMYICIPVYCLYIVYKYLGMTPSGTTVVLLLFFIFLVFPCIILLFVLVICAFFHTCTFLMELSLLIKNLNILWCVRWSFRVKSPQKIYKIKKHDIPDLYRSLHWIRFYLEFCLQFRQHVDHKNVVVPEALRQSSAGQT
jgi:hypothetical protein